MSPQRSSHQAKVNRALRNDDKQPQEDDQSCLLSDEKKDEDKDNNKKLLGERREPMELVEVGYSLNNEDQDEDDDELGDKEKDEDEIENMDEDKDEVKDMDEDEDEDADVYKYEEIDLSNLKELRCPICLGIMRKTKAVMECMHRFCGKCIEKSMRLCNNECPVCREHCPSRRSLRDDPNFDNIISILFPDIDKYEEEEELAILHQAQKTHTKEKSVTVDADGINDANASHVKREITSSANVRQSSENVKSSRLSRFIDHLHNTDVNDDELDIQLVVFSLDEQKMSNLQKPYLSCKPTCSVKILCKYVALKLELEADNVELMLVEKSKVSIMRGDRTVDPETDKFFPLQNEETLAGLKRRNVAHRGYLFLSYKMK